MNGIMMTMKSTIHYKKWDIILVPFPFTDLSNSKKRPSLIISPNEFNKYDDVLIAFVTSHIPEGLRFGDYKITDLNSAGLPKASIIRMKFSTINKSIIIKKIGELSIIDQKEFNAMLLKFFSE